MQAVVGEGGGERRVGCFSDQQICTSEGARFYYSESGDFLDWLENISNPGDSIKLRMLHEILFSGGK